MVRHWHVRALLALAPALSDEDAADALAHRLEAGAACVYGVISVRLGRRGKKTLALVAFSLVAADTAPEATAYAGRQIAAVLEDEEVGEGVTVRRVTASPASHDAADAIIRISSHGRPGG